MSWFTTVHKFDGMVKNWEVSFYYFWLIVKLMRILKEQKWFTRLCWEMEFRNRHEAGGSVGINRVTN